MLNEPRDKQSTLYGGLLPAGWWPCERCGESPWPQQVQLCADGYRCDPCRGGMYPPVVKATTSTGQALVQRRPVVPIRHVIPQRRAA
ncbi:MAG TPA: hypothetical protein VGH54_26535 [Mycobacterium sp.]|uniref:hypothetical protein n=1 Tax=Mycobacterium sp. TaxID=1785 RepID=UPI002F3E2C9B